jgi:hypothetical protein
MMIEGGLSCAAGPFTGWLAMLQLMLRGVHVLRRVLVSGLGAYDVERWRTIRKATSIR